MKEECTQYHRATDPGPRVKQEYMKILRKTHVEIKSMSIAFGCEECDSCFAFSRESRVLKNDLGSARARLTERESIRVV